MHRQDLRKIIYNFDYAVAYVVKYNPAWKGDSVNAEKFLYESAEYMLEHHEATAISTGGLYIHVMDRSDSKKPLDFEVLVTPFKGAL